MPIYEFVCDKCHAKREVDRPVSRAGELEICFCGVPMRRRFSPIHFVIPQTGRDKVLNTLNREEGSQTYPGGEKHGARYDQAMAKGLDRNGQPGQYGSGVAVTSRTERQGG